MHNDLPLIPQPFLNIRQPIFIYRYLYLRSPSHPSHTTLWSIQLKIDMSLVLMSCLFQGTGISSCKFSSISRTIRRGTGVLISPALVRLMHFALAHPALKARALASVCRSPALESWLFKFAASRGITAGGTIVQASPDHTRLTPSALRIYNDLKAAIEEHSRES
jgi:hypothetical protein